MVTWYAESDAHFQELLERRVWYYQEQVRIGHCNAGQPLVKVRIERIHYGRYEG